MTTLADMVVKTRRRSLSDLREETDQLGSNIGANAGSLALKSGNQLGSIRAGAIIEIDYELFLVTDASTPTAISVIPGYLGTTSAAHTANTLISVNPRFPNADIAAALNEDIDDLSSPTNGLFQMREVTINYNPVIIGYDLTGVDPLQLIEVHEVRTHDYGPAQAWPILAPRSYKVERNADPAVFPSGLSIKLYESAFPGRPIRVQYKAPYNTPLVNPTDDVQQVCGLHPQAHDIPELGATVRLMEYRELKRSFTEAQGEPRRSQEVPVGASLTAMKGVSQRRDMRIQAERSRLNSMWPRQWR